MSDASLRHCHFCGSGPYRPIFEAFDFDSGRKRFNLTACPGCGAARLQPMPSETELARYYDPAYYGSGEEKFHPALEWLTRRAGRNRARSLLRLTAETSERTRVLDIGCGRGNLLRAFAALGCECHGVERPDFTPPANAADIRYHLEALEPDLFPCDRFDVIVIWHVLEHLYEPVKILEMARDWLKPGGVLVVAVPNMTSRQSRWFGADWFHLDLPRHLWHLTPGALESQWRRLEMEKIAASGLSLEQNPYGFIQSAANRWLPGPPNALYRAIKSRSWWQLLAWSPFVALLLPFALMESLFSASEEHGATLMHAVRKPD